MGASWHLQQVEVFHPILNKLYVFPCNEWLETSKDKGVDGCKRTLLTGAAAADAGIVSFDDACARPPSSDERFCPRPPVQQRSLSLARPCYRH